MFQPRLILSAREPSGARFLRILSISDDVKLIETSPLLRALANLLDLVALLMPWLPRLIIAAFKAGFTIHRLYHKGAYNG